jgi:hypothetical protein
MNNLSFGGEKIFDAKNRRKPEKTGEKGSRRIGGGEHRTPNTQRRTSKWFRHGTVPGLAGADARATFKGHCSFFIGEDSIKKHLRRKTYGKFLVVSDCKADESDSILSGK